MKEIASKTLEIDHIGKMLLAQESARTFAKEIGFSELECEEIAIAVSELATNLAKHAKGGTIRLTQCDSRPGIYIESEDSGPGIQNLEAALVDGYTTGGGLGIGLGTVNRLMDELDIAPSSRSGTKVVCRRWVRPKNDLIFPRLLEFGVATRSKLNEDENGDDFVIKSWSQNSLVGLIDGLGHGEMAKRAAQTARFYIENHFDQSLDNIFCGVDRACRATRGVVMALARFDLSAHNFSLASIGNIEVRFFGNTPHENFVIRRGIVGVNAPKPVITTHAWQEESILVLHSDGIHTHWNWEDFPKSILQIPEELARMLLQSQGKYDDDASVVVIRNVKNDV